MKKFIESFRELKHYKKHFGREMKVNLVWLSRKNNDIDKYVVLFGHSDKFLTEHLKTEVIL